MPETETLIDANARRAAAAEKMGTKPFKLNPPKKGYGASTPGLLFGPGPKKGEAPKLGKEYEHLHDPFDAPFEAPRPAPPRFARRPPFLPLADARVLLTPSPRPSRPRPSRPLPTALAPRAAAQAAKAERRHAMEMIADRAPYRTMGASVDFFDGYVPVRPALQPTPLLRPY